MTMTRVLGATPPAVAPGVGVVLVPQPASTAEVASATIVVIVRSAAWRVGDTGVLVRSGKASSEGYSASHCEVWIIPGARPGTARGLISGPRCSWWRWQGELATTHKVHD
jgi:hypothetical protein